LSARGENFSKNLIAAIVLLARRENRRIARENAAR
jgi:hypothetical protein